jgi:hypothetical protein
MTIKTQKIIRFIPIINLITVIFWIKKIFDKKLPVNYCFKPMFKAFAMIMIVAIVEIIFSSIVDVLWLTSIVSMVGVYLYSLILSFIFVDEQEKISD